MPSSPKKKFHSASATVLALTSLTITTAADAHRTDSPLMTHEVATEQAAEGIPPLPAPAVRGRDLGMWMYLLLPVMFYFLMRNRRRRVRPLRVHARG